VISKENGSHRLTRQMPKRKHAFIILILTVATLAFGAGALARFVVLSGRSGGPDQRLMSASAAGPIAYVVGSAEPQARAGPVADADKQLFTDVFDRLASSYVHEITDTRAVALGAVKNMLTSLDDPDCLLIPAEQARDYLDQQSGRYHGIGAVVRVQEEAVGGEEGSDQKLVIVSPVAGGPAAKAGLLPGDTIEKVNGKAVLSLNGFYRLIKTEARFEEVTHSVDPATLPLVLQRLQERGDVDTRDKIGIEDARTVLRSSESRIVDLTVQREGSKKALDFEVECRPFVPTAVTHAAEGATGTIAVHSFAPGTYDSVREALAELSGAGAKSLVVDLRDNPGGSLDEATRVAQLFVAGVPLAQIECQGTLRRPLNPTGDVDRIGQFELVVLCNHGTAGAAEFLAGALVDEAGARLAGSQTFGIAEWLKTLVLGDGSIVQFRAGELLTPGGTRYAGSGLSPETKIAGADSNEPVTRARVMSEALKLF
jgi:carboxyl-terminal processing protease